jgi:hypothetical protein
MHRPVQSVFNDHQKVGYWFAPELAIQIDLGIRQHLVGSLTDRGGSDEGRGWSVEGPGWAAAEAVLDAVAEVRDLSAGDPRRGHDGRARSGSRCRSVDGAGIRQVAKDGALSALAESRPGIKAGTRDVELDAAKAEIARLSETVKDMAVKLMLVEGKGGRG